MALHNAAKNIGGGKRRSPVIPIVLVVALIAAVVVLTKMANRTSDEMAATKALGQPEVRITASGRGQRGKTKLSDNTQVQMGSDSHLRIPPGYNAQVRVVGVDGSIQFTVTEDNPKLPFRVRVRDVGMIPRGKVISVRAYEEDPEVIIMANDGPVDVHPRVREAETVVVAQGTALAVANDGKTRVLSPEEATAAFSWVDGTIVLDKMPLKKVINVMSRWYGTHVKTDAALESREVSATLKLDSSKEALEAIATSVNGHLGFVGDTLVIADGLNAAAAKKKK